ncbi:MAG: Ig-like domain-containing protein [Ruminococcus sp.]|nr:Ig-like domain-containing protein [Ruminococcus sp.]
MKKSISIILAVLMLLSIFSVTAMAKNGPNPDKDEFELYNAKIYLYNVLEDGGDIAIYSDNEVHKNAIEGAVYDRETNTLTLKDFNHPEFSLSLTDMGDDFKLNIEGDCVLYNISSSTEDYGGSLTVTGTGLLTVNPEKRDETAVRLMAYGADSTLHIDNTVSVKFLSCWQAVYFQGTAHADKDTVFTQGADTVEVEGGKETYESPKTIDGAYVIRDNGTVVGYRAHEINDPNYMNGLYSVTISEDPAGQKIYHIVKYVISEKLGVWVKDESFEEQDLAEDEFNNNLTIDTSPGSTPKTIEYTDGEGVPQTGYLVEDTQTGGYMVIDINYNEDDDGMIHRAKPIVENETGGYIIVTTWSGYEVNRDTFFEKGLQYVFEEEYTNFEEPNIETSTFEVYEDDDKNQYVLDAEDNVYKIDEDNKITIDEKEYYILTMWQGVLKDNLNPVYDTVEGDYYNYNYPDEDYIYTAPKPATPDEAETTVPATPDEPATTEAVEPTTSQDNTNPEPTTEPQATTDPQGEPATAQPATVEPTTAQPATVEPTNAQPETKPTEVNEHSISEIKKGSSEKQVDKFVTKLKTEKDAKGSVFGLLCARQKKATKSSVTVHWNKLKKAKSYVVYGSKCGTTKVIPAYKKIKKITKTSYTQKKLKKGVYFKFLIVALDKNNKVLATSKTVHIVTKGGKYGNDKTVKVNKTKVTLNLKKKKTFKIKAKEVVQSKKLTVKRHRPIKFESNNKKVAKVSSTGKVTAKKKGKATIYVYAQNGFYKKVKITVK